MDTQPPKVQSDIKKYEPKLRDKLRQVVKLEIFATMLPKCKSQTQTGTLG